MSEIVIAERISALMLTSWIPFRSNPDASGSAIQSVRQERGQLCPRETPAALEPADTAVRAPFKNTLPDASVGAPRTNATKNLVTRQNGSYRYLPERDHLR